MENHNNLNTKSGIQTNWAIPTVAALSTVIILLLGRVHRPAINDLFLWMIILSFMLPLNYIKANKTGDGLILKKVMEFQIEVVAIAAFFGWLFLLERAWITAAGFSLQLIFFLMLLIPFLSLLGYLVTYIKAIHLSGTEGWKKHSVIYHYLTIDLSKDQSLRIFIFVFGQILVGILIILLGQLISPWNPLTPMLLIMAVYLLAVSLYLRKKAANVQQDYAKLLKMTQDIKNGTLDGKVTESFGLFNPLKDELDNIQDGLSHAVEHRISSERMKSELITNVSHDLKTPLTAIITYVDLLQDDSLTVEKRKQYLATLDGKTERLKTLIEDLFEVSKATTGNIQMELQEVDVTILMKQTLRGLEDLLAKSDLVIRESYPDEPVMLNLDGGRTHRIFENLIINLVKYAMPGTRAYIDIIKGDYQTDIILRNISAHELKDQIDELSERFVRGDESRSTEGSGLGLAIAKSFVELQGGTFSIKTDGDLFKVIISFKT